MKRPDLTEMHKAGRLPPPFEAVTLLEAVEPSVREWPELVPFDDEDSRKAPDFPIATLPPVLAKLAASVAANTLSPVDLPAVFALGVASAACAGRVRVRAGVDWFEPANLYVLAVLPPSTLKSPVMKRMIAPLEREERDRLEAWREEEVQRAAEREVVKHRIATIKRRKATEVTDHDLREALTKLEELEQRPRPSLLSDDATQEALVRKLASGPHGVFSAEGRPFEHMSGLYQRAGSDGADVYLKAWCQDPIRSARVMTGDLFIPRPCLTLCLAVQPTVIGKLAAREDFRGRGLIARFLCSYPRTKVGFRKWETAQPIDEVASLNYADRIGKLLAVPLPAPDGTPATVQLAADAEPIFLAYRQELEEEQRRDRLLSEWKDLGGKLAGHCARIALVIHMAHHGPAGLERELSGDTVAAAVTLTRYFLAHTIATWDGCRAEPLGARVVRWLAKKTRRTIRTRELHNAFSRAFQKAADARAMAAELAERGYLLPSGPADVWAVNPCLYGRAANPADGADTGGQRRGESRESLSNRRRQSSADTPPTAPTPTKPSAVSASVDSLTADSDSPADSDDSARTMRVSALSADSAEADGTAPTGTAGWWEQ